MTDQGDSFTAGKKRKAANAPADEGQPKVIKTQHPAAKAVREAVTRLQKREEEFQASTDKAPDRLTLAKEIYVATADAIAKVSALEDLEESRAFWEEQGIKEFSELATIESFVILYKLIREELKETLSNDEVDATAKLHLEEQAPALGLSEIEVNAAANYLQRKNKPYKDIPAVAEDEDPGHAEFIHEVAILTSPHIGEQGAPLPEQHEQLVWRLKLALADIVRYKSIKALGKTHLAGTKWSFLSLHEAQFIDRTPARFYGNRQKACNTYFGRLATMPGETMKRAKAALAAAEEFVRENKHVFRVTASDVDVDATLEEIRNKLQE